MKMSVAMGLYIEEQKYRGNSKYTIDYYNNALGMFKRWLGADFNVMDLDLSHFNAYKLFLLEMDSITRISVNTYLRAVKAFLRWLSDEQYINDFTSKIKLVKAERNVILPLSDDEINVLLSAFDNSILGIRNLCIVLLMLDCGMRRNEVVRLNLNDINFDENYLIANGKGRKKRYVMFGDKTKIYLQQYNKKGVSQGDNFFWTVDGLPITNNTIKMMFQRLKGKTGIQRLKPHLLRHTFATRYIINGGNLETLRILLGHSSINITQVYLHYATSQEILKKQHLSLADMLIK